MQLVAGGIGAAVGFAVGGPAGAQIGFSLGTMAYGVLGSKPKGVGPGDLASPGIQLGTPLPRPYGRVRLAVSPIWMPDQFRSTAHTAGKGTSGPTSYTYDTDVLGAVCDGTRVIAVTREWWNKKLIFTALAASSADSLEAASTQDYYASVLDQFGGPSQTPSPLYETAVGAANAPAYRGMFTREYAAVQCSAAKTLPLMEVEVITKGTPVASDLSAEMIGTMAGSGPLAELDDDVAVGDALFVIVQAWGGVTMHAAWTLATQGQTSGGGSTLYVFMRTADGTSDDAELDIGGASSTCVWGSLVIRAATDTPPEFAVSFALEGPGGLNPSPADPTVGFIIAAAFTDRSSPGSQDISGPPDGYTLFASGNFETAFGATVFTSQSMMGYKAVDGGAENPGLFYTTGAGLGGGGEGVMTLAITASRVADTWTPLPETLDDIILAELALIPGFDPADVDVTDVASIEVTGYIAVGPPVTAIADLCDNFYVGIVPGNPIKFIRLGQASVGTIEFADTGVGVGQAGNPFEGIKQGGNDEISGVKAISYPDLNRDHNKGYQRGDRLTTDGPDTQRIETRVVMDAEEAKGRALTATLLARLRKDGSKFAISDKFAAAEPVDSYQCVDRDGNSYLQRITRFAYADGVKDCDWEREDASAYVASASADLSDEPGIELSPAGVAEWEAMDLHQLRDADQGAGYYLAVKVSDDSIGYAYESPDDGTYAEVEQFALDAVFGSVSAVAGTLVASGFFDEGASITVDVGSGTLASATRAALLADRKLNAFCVGINGRWVLGQYRTATPVSAGVYTLTGLLLDRFEDARYVGDVVVGDVFCRLSDSGGFARIERAVAQLGVEHFVKVVAERRSPASIDGVAFTAAGVSLKPLSPVHLRSERDASSGDIEISATRRTRSETRFGGDLGDACPVGEDSEQYRWRLYTDATYATLLRDLGTTTTSAVPYTAAQIAADSNTLYDPLYVSVTQISATVGEGYALQDEA